MPTDARTVVISRRALLEVASLTVAGFGLGGCGFYLGRDDLPPTHVRFREDVGTLQPVWTQVNGLRMYSLVSLPARSDARVIVLVHGSGLSGHYMLPTARELATDFAIHVPDLPGFGDSDKPRQVLNVPELSDWLAAWIRAAGLARASLLGNSFGCQVIADPSGDTQNRP